MSMMLWICYEALNFKVLRLYLSIKKWMIWNLYDRKESKEKLNNAKTNNLFSKQVKLLFYYLLWKWLYYD